MYNKRLIVLGLADMVSYLSEGKGNPSWEQLPESKVDPNAPHDPYVLCDGCKILRLAEYRN